MYLCRGGRCVFCVEMFSLISCDWCTYSFWQQEKLKRWTGIAFYQIIRIVWIILLTCKWFHCSSFEELLIKTTTVSNRLNFWSNNFRKHVYKDFSCIMLRERKKRFETNFFLVKCKLRSIWKRFKRNYTYIFTLFMLELFFWMIGKLI